MTDLASQLTERTLSLVQFLLEIEKYKTIERTIGTSKIGRAESDAEHSWHLAMFVWLLVPELKLEIDQMKLTKMVLMHDLVEIYAGDVDVYDKQHQTGKAEREMVAAKKLFAQLPADLAQEFHSLFAEFEARETLEAKVAQAFDKLQPVLQNIASRGRYWQAKGIKPQDVRDVKRGYFEFDSTIQAIFEHLLDRAQREQLFDTPLVRPK